MVLVENLVGATSWNQPSIQRLRSDVRCQESEEPKSPRETRQVLDKQWTALQICRSNVFEQTCSRTSEGTHECISEFVQLAHACLEQAVIRGVERDAVKRLEAYP